MEPPREVLAEPSPEPSHEPFSAIARVERYALPAFVWWAGGGLILSFVTFVAQETIFVIVLWGIVGLAVALALLLIVAYRVYNEIVQLYVDVQETLHEIAQLTQSLAQAPLQHHAITPDAQRLQMQLVASSTTVYDRDGVAIQFSEIFKEIN